MLHPKKQRGDKIIGNQNQDGRGYDSIVCRPPNTFGSAPRMIAVIAPHQGNQEAEYRRFDKTKRDIGNFQVF